MGWIKVEIVIKNAGQETRFEVERSDNLLRVGDTYCLINDPQHQGCKIVDLSANSQVSLRITYDAYSFNSSAFIILLPKLAGKTELKVSDIFDESGELIERNSSFDLINRNAGVVYMAARWAMSLTAGTCVSIRLLESNTFVTDILAPTGIFFFLGAGMFSMFLPPHNISVLGEEFTVPVSSIAFGVICSSAIYILSESRESYLVSIGCSLAYTAAISAIDNKAMDLAYKF